MPNEGSQTKMGAYYIISFMRDSRKLRSFYNKRKQKSGCLEMRRGGKERLQRFTRKLFGVNMNMFNILLN